MIMKMITMKRIREKNQSYDREGSQEGAQYFYGSGNF